MSKTDQDEQIKTLHEQLEHLQQERDGYSASCHQAEQAERLIREELEDVQRENIRLKGWQDCAREFFGIEVKG